MLVIITILLAYFIGAFPTAFLVGKTLKSIDIRLEGSGNVGGMNLYRSAGLLPGIITVLLDIAKGSLAVYLSFVITGEPVYYMLAGLAAVVGHNYNLFLNFKGGKGLATSLGVFIVLSLQSIPYIFLIAVLLTLLLRDINTAFGTAAVAIPPVLYMQHQQIEWIIFGCALAAVILSKHLPNYRAYLKGRKQIK
ncbi:MAG: glycerol-3-phosphate acyltransferase [Bacillota bacterium]